MQEQPPGGTGDARSSNSSARRLTRSRGDQWVAGVCGGLGEFFGIDSNLVRVVLAASTLFGGAGLAVYALCWLIIPLEGDSDSIGDQIVEWISQSKRAGGPKGSPDEL